MKSTLPLLLKTDFPAIYRQSLQTLQVNLGYLCNQSYQHRHVNAGPKRTELMDGETIGQVLQVIKKHQVQLLDLTGGALDKQAKPVATKSVLEFHVHGAIHA